MAPLSGVMTWMVRWQDAPMGAGEILLEEAAGIALPVDAAQGAEGLRRVALDGKDVIGAAAPMDHLGGLAGGMQCIDGDHLAGNVAPLQEVDGGRPLAAIIAEVHQCKGCAGAVFDQGHGLVMILAIPVGAPDTLAIGGQRPAQLDPGTGL